MIKRSRDGFSSNSLVNKLAVTWLAGGMANSGHVAGHQTGCLGNKLNSFGEKYIFNGSVWLGWRHPGLQIPSGCCGRGRNKPLMFPTVELQVWRNSRLCRDPVPPRVLGAQFGVQQCVQHPAERVEGW